MELSNGASRAGSIPARPVSKYAQTQTFQIGANVTTNDAIDTWFVGFQPTLAAGVWMGYDKPRKLGDRETGGGLSLPVWIGFMEHALKSVPVTELPVPPGVLNLGVEGMMLMGAISGFAVTVRDLSG